MAAQIYADIKDKNSPFEKWAEDFFKKETEVLNSPQLIIENQNELDKESLRKLLHSMDPFSIWIFISWSFTKNWIWKRSCNKTWWRQRDRHSC